MNGFNRKCNFFLNIKYVYLLYEYLDWGNSERAVKKENPHVE